MLREEIEKRTDHFDNWCCESSKKLLLLPLAKNVRFCFASINLYFFVRYFFKFEFFNL